MACAEPEKEPAKMDFNTTTKASFTEKSMKDLQIGARVMKTQDGQPVKRDPVFLSETRIIDKYHAEKLCGKVFNTDTIPDQPTTFYNSQRLGRR